MADAARTSANGRRAERVSVCVYLTDFPGLTRESAIFRRVRMVGERQAPGVQNGGDADLRAEVLAIGCVWDCWASTVVPGTNTGASTASRPIQILLIMMGLSSIHGCNEI